MTQELAIRPAAALSEQIEQVLIQGDLSKLAPADRVNYYKAVCDSVGLNPLTKPFDYITLNGKLTLYAKKDCTDQLRDIHGVSVTFPARELMDGVFVVTAHASKANGRHDESIGAVPIEGLKGEAKANAMMKAETKAKRRVTLSICGLGMLDETEIESIPDARPFSEITQSQTNGGVQPKQVAPAAIDAMAGQPSGTTVKSATPPPMGRTPDELRKALEELKAEYEYHDQAELYGRIIELHAGAPGAQPKTLKAARECVAELEHVLKTVKEVADKEVA